MQVTMHIEDDYREVTVRRPWWFAPGLVGVLLGGLLGLWLLLAPLPPCSPPGANSEIVVRRFLERLGSSATAIEECWASGRLGPDDLRTYLDAAPPASMLLAPYSGSTPLLLGPNAPAYAHWVVVLTWSGPPPRDWPNDEPISIELLRPNSSDRWTIVSAGKSAGHPLGPRMDWSDQLMGEVRAVRDRLAFAPLIPSFMPGAEVSARVESRTCGLAITPCLEYVFQNPGVVLRVLQGPAGCCLDYARPDALTDVEIRPGVNAHFDPAQVQYGGPILWWVEETARGNVYVAVSSPVFGRNELVAVARSMTPITFP